LHAGYRPDIDGLRAVAVLAVVFYHAFPRIVRGGYAGVDVFFVISGFLISGIILDALAAGKFSFTDFYARRIRRIFPALATVLIAALTFGWFTLFSDEYAALGKHAAGGAGFCANILSWLESGDYWATASEKQPLLHLWSLGVEEQFYLLIPALTVILFRWRSRMLTVFGALFAASFVFNLAMRLDHAAFNFYFPATRFWELFAGVWLALSVRNYRAVSVNIASLGKRYVVKIPLSAAALTGAESFRKFLSLTGAVLLAVAVFVSLGRKTYPGFGALVPVFGATFLIWAGANAPVNRVILSHKILVGIGLISYPLYLWHWVFLSFGRIINGGEMPVLTRFILLGLAAAFSVITYFAIEKPLRFGKKWRKIKVVLTWRSYRKPLLDVKTCGLIVVMLGVGVGGYRIQKSSRGMWDEQRLMADGVIAPGWVDAAQQKYGLKNSWENCIGERTLPPIQARVFIDCHSDKTVAVIGDSHASHIFLAMARVNHENGVNTLHLKHYPDPMIFGSDAVRDSILKFLAHRQDVRKVFLATIHTDVIANPEVFKRILQETIGLLSTAGKEVYVVVDNPMFNFDPKNTFRPLPFWLAALLPERHLPTIPRAEIEKQMSAYLRIMAEIKGATLLESLDIFCPQGQNLWFDENGDLLYFDSNHLSLAGGEYRVQKQLAKYLEFPAEE
jgi:peptidoglycan/LPS O-acetylase OafA/YrhL